MDITIFDDRDGWRNRKISTIDINSLSEQWDKVKEFVVTSFLHCKVTIILETHNGHGKLNILSKNGSISYDLLNLRDKVEVIK
jgi:hypothetical protein